jgi:hypothetical protein
MPLESSSLVANVAQIQTKATPRPRALQAMASFKARATKTLRASFRRTKASVTKTLSLLKSKRSTTVLSPNPTDSSTLLIEVVAENVIDVVAPAPAPGQVQLFSDRMSCYRYISAAHGYMDVAVFETRSVAANCVERLFENPLGSPFAPLTYPTEL